MYAGRVENRFVIVTGAQQGIGFSIAELLVKEGAFVIPTDIDDGRGEKAIQRLGKKHAFFLHHDVSQEKDWENVFEQAIQIMGRVDILVNTAGISGLSEGFGPQNPEDLSLNDFRKVQTINTEGKFLGCRYAIKFMKGHGGSIINISSRSANVGVPTMYSYAATKAAIKNLTKSVALWCCAKKYPLRCKSILPVAIHTPFLRSDDWRKRSKKKIAKLSEEIPLGHMGEPLDVAYAVLYLASCDSKFITGTEIVIDGGILAGSSALPGIIQTKE
ncbi:MAG: SDR family oxidoreductase [Chlamydiae bacterium]|nr:SDR family oxidoreductase [Chlamydiota bacterium]